MADLGDLSQLGGNNLVPPSTPQPQPAARRPPKNHGDLADYLGLTGSTASAVRFAGEYGGELKKRVSGFRHDPFGALGGIAEGLVQPAASAYHAYRGGLDPKQLTDYHQLLHDRVRTHIEDLEAQGHAVGPEEEKQLYTKAEQQYAAAVPQLMKGGGEAAFAAANSAMLPYLEGLGVAEVAGSAAPFLKGSAGAIGFQAPSTAQSLISGEESPAGAAADITVAGALGAPFSLLGRKGGEAPKPSVGFSPEFQARAAEGAATPPPEGPPPPPPPGPPSAPPVMGARNPVPPRGPGRMSIAPLRPGQRGAGVGGGEVIIPGPDPAARPPIGGGMLQRAKIASKIASDVANGRMDSASGARALQNVLPKGMTSEPFITDIERRVGDAPEVQAMLARYRAGVPAEQPKGPPPGAKPTATKPVVAAPKQPKAPKVVKPAVPAPETVVGMEPPKMGPAGANEAFNILGGVADGDFTPDEAAAKLAGIKGSGQTPRELKSYFPNNPEVAETVDKAVQLRVKPTEKEAAKATFTKPAIRTKAGKVVEGPRGVEHEDIIKAAKPAAPVEHGFETPSGQFLNRPEARQVLKAKGAKVPAGKPESTDLGPEPDFGPPEIIGEMPPLPEETAQAKPFEPQVQTRRKGKVLYSNAPTTGPEAPLADIENLEQLRTLPKPELRLGPGLEAAKPLPPRVSNPLHVEPPSRTSDVERRPFAEMGLPDQIEYAKQRAIAARDAGKMLEARKWADTVSKYSKRQEGLTRPPAEPKTEMTKRMMLNEAMKLQDQVRKARDARDFDLMEHLMKQEQALMTELKRKSGPAPAPVPNQAQVEVQGRMRETPKEVVVTEAAKPPILKGPPLPAIRDTLTEDIFRPGDKQYTRLKGLIDNASQYRSDQGGRYMSGWIDPANQTFHQLKYGEPVPGGGPTGPKFPGGAAKGEVVLPQAVVKAGRSLAGARHTFQSYFNPTGIDTAGERAGQVIRQAEGRAKANEADVARDFQQAEDALSQLHPDEQIEFMRRADSGQAQPTPELQTIANYYRWLYSQVREQAKSVAKQLGVPLHHIMPAFKEYYFPRIFKRGAEAERLLSDVEFQKRFLGPQSFRHSRQFPDLLDAIDAAHEKGMELIDTNPARLMQHHYGEVQRYLAGLQAMAKLKDVGLRKYFKLADQRAGKVPPGWVKDPTEVGQVFFRRSGLLAKGGDYFMPESVHFTLKNHLDAGFWTKNWYRTFRQLSNQANQLQLGLSAYHALATTKNAMSTELELGIDNFLHGEPVRGIKRFARAATLVGPEVHQNILGRRLLNSLKEGRMKLELMGENGKLLQAYIDANGQWAYDRENWSGSATASFNDALKQHGLANVHTLARVPLMVMERLGEPLFKHIVQPTKVGAFMEMMGEELRRLPTNASEADVARIHNSVMDSVDNRFGMINYDNLFWNKHWQNTIHMFTRAPGWYLGTAREYGGAIADLAHGKLSRRVRFAIATPLTAAIWASVYQYARTGTVPKVGKDWWETWRNFTKPLTGRNLPDGSPERVQFPGYEKDLEDVYNGLVEEAKGNPDDLLSYASGKVNPVVAFWSALLHNADWRDQQIRDPNDPIARQLADVAKWSLENEVAPVSIQNWVRRREEEANRGELTSRFPNPITDQQAREALMGISTPKRRWISTPFRNALYEAERKSRPKGPLTKQQVSSMTYRRILENTARTKPDQFPQLATQFYQKGYLDIQDIKKAQKASEEDPVARIIKQSDVESLLANWQLASPQEQQEVIVELGRKIKAKPDYLAAPKYARYKPIIMHILLEYEKGHYADLPTPEPATP